MATKTKSKAAVKKTVTKKKAPAKTASATARKSAPKQDLSLTLVIVWLVLITVFIGLIVVKLY